MSRTLTARRLVTDIGVVEFPVLTIASDGTLTDIGTDPRTLAKKQDTLAAAFLDIHSHGAVGYDVMSASPAELTKLQRFLATRGVAHYLPTTLTASIETTLHSLETLAATIESGVRPGEAQPVAIHLEGPFLSHIKRGVHPEALLQPPSIELFDRFQQAARGHIQLMTIAPEVPGALDLIRHARSHGVRLSLGHTNAVTAETLAAIDAGASSVTHTFNAMRALDHREPGVVGVTLDDDRLFAELICDGLHVAPALVRLWLKAKGPERAILVTDAMAAAGMPDGDYRLGDLMIHVVNGRAIAAEDLAQGRDTLAGSTLTMDRAFANLLEFTGTSLAGATRLASHNPAVMLGRPELTRLAPGSPANLNRFDARNRLIATYIHGRQVTAD